MITASVASRIFVRYLTKIFREQTDENHMLNISEIIEKLGGYDASVDRKTLQKSQKLNSLILLEMQENFT